MTCQGTMIDNLFTIAVVLLAILSAEKCHLQAQCCEEYCYTLDNERPQLAHFGTKTANKVSRGSETGRQFIVPDCEPVKIWMLNRHGTELPPVECIEEHKSLGVLRDEIVNNYQNRGSKPDIGGLCETDLDLLKQWTWNPNITEETAGLLTEQGWHDLKSLAIRFQRAFPAILEKYYDQRKFLFRYTSDQLCEDSFKAFVGGLFGEEAFRYVKVSPSVANDTLLLPYDYCASWCRDKAAIEKLEYRKFEKSQIFADLISDVSVRLGFKDPLRIDQIGTIFHVCRYNQLWKPDEPSPWCSAFTPNQVNVLEYRDDLKNFFSSGYGRPSNTNLQCEAVADLLSHLQSSDLPKVVAYFSHSVSLRLFLTAMGVARDSEALRADNYHRMAQRKWRGSVISPIAANFAAVKYDCTQDKERPKVKFFLNENPIDFSWCADGLCNLSDVQKMYERFSQGDCASTFCSAE